MELEERLYAVLGSTNGGRVWPVLAPQDSALPRITFQRVSNAPVNDLRGHSGMDIVRVQVDVWAADYLSGKHLATTVRDTLSSSGIKHLFLSDLDDYEPETKLYRVRMDLQFWHPTA